MMLQRATKRRIPTLQQSGTDCTASSGKRRTQIPESQMTEKAYHEAGHAVAASVLGQPIKQATMDGVTTLVKVGCDQARRNEAIIAMAGPAAEARAKSYSAEQSEELWNTVWAVDKEYAKRQLGGAGTEHAMRQARWIVRRQLGRRHEGSGGSGEARHALRRRCRRLLS